MTILTSVRQSPTYLYLKVYLICSLVSLFQAAPVSSRIPAIQQQLPRLHHGRLVPAARPALHRQQCGSTNSSTTFRTPSTSGDPHVDPVPPSRVRIVLDRWHQRAKDLAQVRELMKRDDLDLRTYPELAWDASVRRSASLHPEELRFLDRRRQVLSSQGTDALHRFLQLPATERVHPADVPLVALGGSGGGYRAMYGFAGFLAACKRQGLWDCLTWTAGVSGSCWALAAYYTIAYHSTSRLIQHYVATAKEVAHPMSVEALDKVARSSKGVYFLLAPLLRKAQGGLVGLGIMDLYATLTTSYQFLSREPRARLSRASFQLSKIWRRSGLDLGLEPMPLFTAVRVAPHDSPGVKPRTDSSMSKGQPPRRALRQHKTSSASTAMEQTGASAASHAAQREAEDPASSILSLPTPKGFFQWFEISPLEVGNADVEAYIPTWAWGRAFISGRSLKRMPEHSLSLLLGQCTSAPAGPLTGYISALLASLPKGTVMSRLLMLLNDFVRMKRWERRWGNPIRAGDEPNPFYGLNTRPDRDQAHHEGGRAERSAVVGIGIDLLHLPRLHALAVRQASRAGEGNSIADPPPLAAIDRLARRILCRAELKEWDALRDATRVHRCSPTPNSTSDAAMVPTNLVQFLAVRWSAKEAAYKALYPSYLVSWKDLCLEKPSSSGVGQDLLDRETSGTRSKKPRLRMSDEWLAAQNRPDGGEAPALHLSVSHDGEYVATNVLALRNQASRISAVEWQPAALFPLSSDKTSKSARSASLTPSLSDVPTRNHDALSLDADPSDPTEPHLHATTWETSSRIRLMDSGMSNNLPNHILARKERGADVIVAFDASSDVQKGSAIQRIRNFADDCGIHLRVRDDDVVGQGGVGKEEERLTREGSQEREVEDRFRAKYAQRIDAWRVDGQDELAPGHGATGEARDPDIRFVYCPLLPNSIQPDFDPSTATFSNSYNLVWTPEQVETVVRTSSANLEGHAVHVIRQAMREAYEAKKKARLARQLDGAGSHLDPSR